MTTLVFAAQHSLLVPRGGPPWSASRTCISALLRPRLDEILRLRVGARHPHSARNDAEGARPPTQPPTVLLGVDQQGQNECTRM